MRLTPHRPTFCWQLQPTQTFRHIHQLIFIYQTLHCLQAKHPFFCRGVRLDVDGKQPWLSPPSFARRCQIFRQRVPKI